MKRSAKLAIFVVIVGALAALLVWAFLEKRGELARERALDRPITTPTRVLSTGRGNFLILDKTARMKSGITVAPLRDTTQREAVTAYGQVLDLQELLDWLNSYARAGGESGKVRSELEVARTEYLRLKGLHDDSHNVSEKALQAAEGVWRSASAQAKASEETMANLRASARQHWGSVVTRWLLDRSPNLDRLIRQESALIRITVPSGTHLPAPPHTIEIEVTGSDPVRAALVSPSPRMNPNLQGASYFYLASSAQENLPPGMNVTASLPAGRAVQGILIPSPAVVWWQGKAWIYLLREEGKFERVEIPTDHPLPGGWFAVDRLSRSDSAVVTGAQLLLSEELRSQIKIGG